MDERSGADLESCSDAFQKLLPFVISAPSASIEILFLKIDDAFRRSRRASRPLGDGKARANVDRLLDYCQALEAILPVKGPQIPEFAAQLLHSRTPAHSGMVDTLDLLKDMYTLRNMVMHGKLDQVLEGRAGTRFQLKDVERFQWRVHHLAILYFLNIDQSGNPSLRQFIKKLRNNHPLSLKTLY